MGYPYLIKGYKFFNLHTKSVLISRNAIFHEHIFPYASNLIHISSDVCFINLQSPSETTPLPLPIESCSIPITLDQNSPDISFSPTVDLNSSMPSDLSQQQANSSDPNVPPLSSVSPHSDQTSCPSF